MGAAHPQPDACEAALLERGDEFSPEALALAVAHLEVQVFTAAIGIDAHGHNHRPRAHPEGPAQPALEAGDSREASRS